MQVSNADWDDNGFFKIQLAQSNVYLIDIIRLHYNWRMTVPVIKLSVSLIGTMIFILWLNKTNFH